MCLSFQYGYVRNNFINRLSMVQLNMGRAESEMLQNAFLFVKLKALHRKTTIGGDVLGFYIA